MDASDGKLKCQCPHPLLGWMILGVIPLASWEALGNLAALTPSVTSVTCSHLCPRLRLCFGKNPPEDPIHTDSFTSLLPALCQSLHRYLQPFMKVSMNVCLGMCFISFRLTRVSWTSETCYPRNLEAL